MAELRTEEEQIEAIKNWWKNNGSSLLIGIGAALAIVFGWQTWQTKQAEERSVAASQFASLLNALSENSDEKRIETVTYITGDLQENYEDSAYAVYGSLILAQQQLLDQSKLDAAEESLQWAHARVEKGAPLELVIRSRLAQTQLTAGRHEDALKTLREAGDSGAFAALYAELEGDILLASGDKLAAKEAYRTAREATLGGRNGVLELKLSDLAVGEDA
ncbi:YfgM family protein [Marinobacter caseinilyticus]|uniref:YfgM family protein n=1 Tax=Marinobacter caseinilyticus TaxID=2692195 RepID=UPI00140E5C9C|nr:tetratricopeptide repeat protein [Marinobacter caseinilyticus]